MTREQRRLVALIAAIVVTVVGGLGGFLAWSAHHQAPGTPTTAAQAPSTPPAASPLATTPSPVTATARQAPQIDGYSPDFEATQDQKETAISAATAMAQWSQTESPQSRTQRLEEFYTTEAASQPPPWQQLYGSIKGAYVTVESAGQASTSSNDGSTIGVGVMVTYTVHIPHDDGTEVTTRQSGLWVISMPIQAAKTKATAAQWPPL